MIQNTIRETKVRFALAEAGEALGIVRRVVVVGLIVALQAMLGRFGSRRAETC